MKKVLLISIFAFSFSACSTNFQKNTLPNNKLKSEIDLQVEKNLTSGTWKYQREEDDCKNTVWEQTFHSNRYYESSGAACLIPDAFRIDAENWHIKNQILYITKLSIDDSKDIILKYGVEYLDNKSLKLSRGNYTYTFIK